MERSGIAVEGTIKEGLHKTPTTVFAPQLFDARFLIRDTALLILYEIRDMIRALGLGPDEALLY